jgi:iron complex transport system ATP-binding protein
MTPLLQASNLSFAYADTPVLRDISLTLAPGELLTLLGPNGSGKSTLILALLGHLPASGTILWESRPLKSWPRRDLARRVAYLPQSPAFEPDQTVLDVLRLGRAPYWHAFGVESQRDTRIVLEIANLLSLTDLLPRRMDQLSGGQRQRVFIGRCLVQEPRALLLDEPNTHLDLRHQVELGHLLRRLSRENQIAILMASHDLNLAGAFADQMILLNNGAVAAGGPPGEVLREEVLSNVYGVPINRIERPGQPPLVFPVI